VNIVLDIGNVICRWQPEQLVASVFPDRHDQRVALQAVIQQEDWLDLDRGRLELDAAIDQVLARSELPREQIEALYRAVPKHLEPVPAMVSAIERLAAAGVPLYVLSNMHHHAWQELLETHDFWRHFRGIVVSCEVGVIKPEAAIYELLCERYQLEPADTLFFDDMQENVDGARQCGLQAQRLENLEMAAEHVIAVVQAQGLWRL
jgi:putative hydrolase of the HAD superfamily